MAPNARSLRSFPHSRGFAPSTSSSHSRGSVKSSLQCGGSAVVGERASISVGGMGRTCEHRCWWAVTFSLCRKRSVRHHGGEATACDDGSCNDQAGANICREQQRSGRHGRASQHGATISDRCRPTQQEALHAPERPRAALLSGSSRSRAAGTSATRGLARTPEIHNQVHPVPKRVDGHGIRSQEPTQQLLKTARGPRDQHDER